MFADIPASAILVECEILNDVVTAGTDWDLGLYKTDGGAVVDKDIYVDAADLSTGHANGSGLTGLSALNIDQSQKKLYENAAETLKTTDGSYDIALTANVVGSSVSTVVVKATFLQG